MEIRQSDINRSVDHAVQTSPTIMPSEVRDGLSPGVDLLLLWQGIRRRLWSISYFVLGGLGLTALYLVSATPRYTATASVLIDPRQPKVFNIEAVLPGLDPDQYFIESQLEILRSPRIAKRLFEQMKTDGVPLQASEQSTWIWFSYLTQAFETNAVESSSIETPTKLVSSARKAEDDQKVHSTKLINSLLRNLKVVRKGRSRIIELNYVDKNAKRAADMANGFVDAYLSDQVAMKFQATHSANSWLKERIDSLAVELREAEWRIQKFRTAKDIVEIGEVTLANKEVSDHALALVSARARAAEAEARLAQVDTLSNQIERDALNNQVKLLETELENLKRRMLKGSEDLIRLDELKREATASQTLYLALLNRYKETLAQDKLLSPDARVVAYAVEPSRPSHPKKGLLLALSLFGWLGVGTGVALWRELRNPTFHSPLEVERTLGLPCIAEIPIEASLAKYGSRQIPPLRTREKLFKEMTDDFSESIFTVRRWTKAIAEQGAVVFVVMSANPKEGRSLLAAQLARAAAAKGSRTLLVDADLRTAGLTHALGIESDNGLGAVLSNIDFSCLIRKLGEDHLHFCPGSHSEDTKPLDILGSRALENFFSNARENYDLIIVDTPPSGTYVDASALLDVADAAIVVVKAADTLHADAIALIRELNMSGAPPAGVVLNMVTSRYRKRSRSDLQFVGILRPSDRASKRRRIATDPQAAQLERQRGEVDLPGSDHGLESGLKVAEKRTRSLESEIVDISGSPARQSCGESETRQAEARGQTVGSTMSDKRIFQARLANL